MKLLTIALLAGSLAYAQTDIGGRNFKGRLNATLAPSTAPFTTGLLSARSSACTQGDVYFSTDASAGSNLSLCTTTGAPGTWTVVSSSGGVAWGGITGTYTDQADLVGALATKEAALTFAARLNRSVNTIDLAAGVVTPASCGDATHSCSLTVDTYGRVTAATNNAITTSGTGDVVGPSSATDNAIPRYDSTTGKLLQNSLVTIDDSGNITTPGTISTGDGTVAGGPKMYEITANGNNFRQWLVPDAVTASLTMLFGDSVPTAGQVMRFGAPSSNISAQTWADASGVGACSANTWASTLNNNAAPTCTQPAFSNLSGTVSTSQIAANAVTSAKMAVVNTRRTGCIVIGANNASAAIADTDLGPQSRQYLINSAQTLVEITVAADAGTPNIILGRSRAGTIVNLTSSALATAASGGIACSKGTAVTGLDGATTCAATLQNTGLNAGDWITLVSGTAGGTAKEMTACFTTTVD